MAEIAEAIHDILENDGDSDATSATGATSAIGATGAASPSNAVVTPADFGAENTQAAPEAAPDSEAAAPPEEPEENANAESGAESDDGLEAAIAADLADQPTAAIGHFGGAPDLSDITNPANPPDPATPDPAAKTEAAPQSDLHYLPLRMRDTLADLKTGHADSRAATQALLDKMQTARDAMLDEMRRAMTDFAGRITTRQAALQEEMAQINQELAELQTALEMLAVNHHRQNTQAHEQYQENFTAERQRVSRYRDFLQFLLRERGM